ncbi:hypothetical protein PanWU01x14_025620 [Parasponia andersonii]|uniref:Uncharacterized protein n=1 Tax=Parasponia andersonii TaxID=3476 RepID=A0A2P5DWY3_PARAD|nr:hypothetical protein PanWU01x14_025620 [Parasponia andersonii]
MLSCSGGAASKQSFPYWCMNFQPREILTIICMMTVLNNYHGNAS